jgi:predicted nucleic acid-binding protein
MDFPNIPILGEDYVEAARFFNQLQGRGITGWNVDLLICAVANRLSLDVFTRDEDFTHFAKHITVRLYPVGN